MQLWLHFQSTMHPFSVDCFQGFWPFQAQFDLTSFHLKSLWSFHDPITVAYSKTRKSPIENMPKYVITRSAYWPAWNPATKSSRCCSRWRWAKTAWAIGYGWCPRDLFSKRFLIFISSLFPFLFLYVWQCWLWSILGIKGNNLSCHSIAEHSFLIGARQCNRNLCGFMPNLYFLCSVPLLLLFLGSAIIWGK